MAIQSNWVTKYFHDDALEVLQCPVMNDFQVVQGVSLKAHGNMALHTGDQPEMVVERRIRFLERLGLSIQHLNAAEQVHGDRVQIVNGLDSHGGISLDDAYPATDALITRTKGVILSTYTADCLPVFIYDPVTPAIGLVHSGWRGTVKEIVIKTLQQMNAAFQCRPENCHIAIGPAIRSCCFQVNEEVASLFASTNPAAVHAENGKFQVDLIRYITDSLIKFGVRPENIWDSEICTCCNPSRYYSYRAEQGVMGRMMGVIALQK